MPSKDHKNRGEDKPKRRTYGYTTHIRPDSQVPIPSHENASMNGDRYLYRPTPTKTPTRPSISSPIQEHERAGRAAANTGRAPAAQTAVSEITAAGETKLETRPYLISPKFGEPPGNNAAVKTPPPAENVRQQADKNSAKSAVPSIDIPDDGRSPLPSWSQRLQKFTYNTMNYQTPSQSQQERAIEGIQSDGGQPTGSGDPRELSVDTAISLPASKQQQQQQSGGQQKQSAASQQLSHGSRDRRSGQKTAHGSADQGDNPPSADYHQSPADQRHPPSWWEPPTDAEIARVGTPKGIRTHYKLSGRQRDQAGKPKPLNYRLSYISVPEAPSLTRKRNEYQEYDPSTKGRNWRNLVGKQVPKPKDPTPDILTPVPEADELTPGPTPLGPSPHSYSFSVPSKFTETPGGTPPPDSAQTDAYSVPSKKTETPPTPKYADVDSAGIERIRLSQPMSKHTIKGMKGTSYPWVFSMNYENEVPFGKDKLAQKNRRLPGPPEGPEGVYPRMVIEDEDQRPKRETPEPPDPRINLRANGGHFWDNRKGKYWEESSQTPEEYDFRQVDRAWIPGHKHFHMGVDVNSVRYGRASQMSVWQGDYTPSYQGSQILDSRAGSGGPRAMSTTPVGTYRPPANNIDGHGYPGPDGGSRRQSPAYDPNGSRMSVGTNGAGQRGANGSTRRGSLLVVPDSQGDTWDPTPGRGTHRGTPIASNHGNGGRMSTEPNGYRRTPGAGTAVSGSYNLSPANTYNTGGGNRSSTRRVDPQNAGRSSGKSQLAPIQEDHGSYRGTPLQQSGAGNRHQRPVQAV